MMTVLCGAVSNPTSGLTEHKNLSFDGIEVDLCYYHIYIIISCIIIRECRDLYLLVLNCVGITI